MTKLIKRKGLLFLMAIAVMVAMMSVACKKKVTQPVDFSVAEVVDVVDEPIEEPTTPEEPAIPETPEKPATPEEPVTPETLKPDSALTIDAGRWWLLQYGDRYFESADFTNPDGTKFRYTVRFIKQADNSILIKFTGYDKKGVKIDKTYAGGSAKSSSVEKQVYAPYQFALRESADLIVYATGYIEFKSKELDNHVKLALKNK